MASEPVLDSIRKKLNDARIKLWLSPYTEEGTSTGIYPEVLLEQFGKELKLSQEAVKMCFEQLRCHALEKLAAKTRFETTGMAVLRLKVLGDCQESVPRVLNLESPLNISGADLCKNIGTELGISSKFLKLITQGKVIKPDLPLKEQNIKNNSSVMVIVPSEKDSANERRVQELYQTRSDAELLANMDIDQPSSEFNLQIADQTGKVLDLPVQERKSLTIAMTLHEKSRNAMKQRKYETALPILLEADNEFKQCTGEILNLVDNYALLNMDIVWCYLCLRSINFLPDAERRLTICQSCFDKSYGKNLERLQALKGDKSKERALFTRLHLLQGIVAYHHGNQRLAKSLLTEVRSELNFLKVDDEKLSQVMGLGYSSTEARLALRSSGGNIELAVDHIIARREEKAAIKKRNEQERKTKAESQKLGKTLRGEWLNPVFHKNLMDMGYSYSEAQQALQNSDNSVSLAVQILQEHRHLLKPTLDEAAVAKVISLGFSVSAAKRALEKSQGNVEDALAALFAVPPSASTSSSANADPQHNTDASLETDCLQAAAQDAAFRLAEEIATDEEDYLDLNMSEEEIFLQEYLGLLESLTPEEKPNQK